MTQLICNLCTEYNTLSHSLDEQMDRTVDKLTISFYKCFLLKDTNTQNKNNKQNKKENEDTVLVANRQKIQDLENQIKNLRNQGGSSSSSDNKSSQEEMKCDWCKRKGHTDAQCHYKRKNDRSMFKCTYCDLPWHTVDKCFKKIKDTETSSNTDRVILACDHALNCKTDGVHKNDWILDSGATAHMTNSKEKLYNTRKVKAIYRLTYIFRKICLGKNIIPQLLVVP